MFPRLAASRVKVALADTPVVFLMGPRQCGKTTLIKSIVDDAWEYITLDDRTQFEIARADPVGFVRNLPPGVSRWTRCSAFRSCSCPSSRQWMKTGPPGGFF